VKFAAIRFLVIVGALAILTAAYVRVHTTSTMTDAAKVFLASLTPAQRAQATYPFSDDERFDWHYIPKDRKGLPLRDMTSEQKQLAHALLAAGLSQRGYIKATTIMSLDEVLKIMEQEKGPHRDPDGYFFTVFGEPSESGTWGYRVEGHHVSQNFTISGGKVVDGPSFFGANPAEVLDGPRKGVRVLAREDDLGLALIQSLSAEQKKVAVVDKTAPNEIVTQASREAALKGQASGLEAGKMNAHQRELLAELLDEYCNNVPEEMAQSREDQVKRAGANLYFAWAGGEVARQPHYYRIQAPAFLVEFDDTQDHANHIHSVWRDFQGDFGRDLLKEHYQSSHQQ